MRGSSEPVPECWEPPAGGALADPLIPQLIVLLELRACWFESFPFDVQLPRIEPGRIVLPAEEPGVSSWPLGIGVELSVRYRGLTLGRFVLVPATPTSGVAFSPARRGEAIAMVEPLGARIAEALIADSNTAAPNATRVGDELQPDRARPVAATPADPPRSGVDRLRETRGFRPGVARHVRRSARRRREGLA